MLWNALRSTSDLQKRQLQVSLNRRREIREKISNWTEETASIHLHGISKTCSTSFCLFSCLHFCAEKYGNSCMKTKICYDHKNTAVLKVQKVKSPTAATKRCFWKSATTTACTSPFTSTLPAYKGRAAQEFPEPDVVSVFNSMLVIPPDSIRACLCSRIEEQDLSPVEESDFQRPSQIWLHFETQTLHAKGKQASIKFLQGCTDKLLISVLRSFSSFPGRHMVGRKIPAVLLQPCQIQNRKGTESKKSMLKLKKDCCNSTYA